MTITKRTIKVSAETSIEEFNDIKDFLSNLDYGFYSYVNNYVVAYVLLKNHGYDAVKITDIKVGIDENKVFIEFESKIEND